jgi:hypothetical protein
MMIIHKGQQRASLVGRQTGLHSANDAMEQLAHQLFEARKELHRRALSTLQR